jgi:hypothetical protein
MLTYHSLKQDVDVVLGKTGSAKLSRERTKEDNMIRKIPW